MAKIIAISGPSSTGKSAIVDKLNSSPELYGSICSPDIYNRVWEDLVEQGYFKEFAEISKDSEYLCIYLLRLIEWYDEYLTRMSKGDELIILDGSWVDFNIFALINMWYMRFMKDLQEDIFYKILALRDKFDIRIYFTQYDENLVKKEKYRTGTRVYNATANKGLEVAYYKMMEDMTYARPLPSSDPDECAEFIIKELNMLGYLQ